jgi:Glycosyltransferase
LGAKRVYVIPYGIDVNMFKPAEQNTRLEAFKILFVGRLTYQKGVDILCEAIKLLSYRTCFKRMSFTIIGSGSMESFVRTLTAKLSNVSFLGYLQRDLLPDIYRSHHILVMPSRWETLGLTAIEAQACGLPVIGTKVPGLKDVIVDGLTCELIPPEDPLSLANSILKFYKMYNEDAEAFRHMAILSRRRASEVYDWNIVIESFCKMLSDVLNESTHACHLHSDVYYKLSLYSNR